MLKIVVMSKLIGGVAGVQKLYTRTDPHYLVLVQNKDSQGRTSYNPTKNKTDTECKTD